MSFIGPDERIVILQYNQYERRDLTDDELARLADGGIKTVACYLRWQDSEPRRGIHEWSAIDRLVAQHRKAGLKTIVKVYCYAPTFFPDNWYLRAKSGDVQRHVGPRTPEGDNYTSTLSYWCPEAWAYHLQFVEEACQHFSAKDVLCINISPANGEALIPGNAYLYDAHAIESYRQHAGRADIPDVALPGSPTLDWLRETVIPCQVETQRIFHRYGGEYWTMLHHAFETIPSTGNWLIDDLYRALHAELGDEHWGICYTVFRPGDSRAPWGAAQDVKRHGVKMLFASEGPEGLLRNTKDAIDQGARGMLTGPLAPYMGHARMEEWMYDAIRQSATWWPQ